MSIKMSEKRLTNISEWRGREKERELYLEKRLIVDIHMNFGHSSLIQNIEISAIIITCAKFNLHVIKEYYLILFFLHYCQQQVSHGRELYSILPKVNSSGIPVSKKKKKIDDNEKGTCSLICMSVTSFLIKKAQSIRLLSI